MIIYILLENTGNSFTILKFPKDLKNCECDSFSSVCLPGETLNLHTKLAQYSIRGEERSQIKSINSLPQGIPFANFFFVGSQEQVIDDESSTLFHWHQMSEAI